MFDYNFPTLDCPKPQLTFITFLLVFHAETEIISVSPFIEKSNTEMFYLPSPIVLFKSLSTSDGLFFIRYTPEDTFKQKWFLVQINPEKIAILNMQRETAANCHITFLEQDPANKHLYDNKARW